MYYFVGVGLAAYVYATHFEILLAHGYLDYKICL